MLSVTFPKKEAYTMSAAGYHQPMLQPCFRQMFRCWCLCFILLTPNGYFNVFLEIQTGKEEGVLGINHLLHLDQPHHGDSAERQRIAGRQISRAEGNQKRSDFIGDQGGDGVEMFPIQDKCGGNQ